MPPRVLRGTVAEMGLGVESGTLCLSEKNVNDDRERRGRGQRMEAKEALRFVKVEVDAPAAPPIPQEAPEALSSKQIRVSHLSLAVYISATCCCTQNGGW